MLVVGVVGAATAAAMAAVGDQGGHSHGLLTALVLLVQLCFVVAWVFLLDTPSPWGAIAIAAGASAASDGVLLSAHRVSLGVFAIIMALAFLLSLVWQIGRLKRTRVTESLAAVLSATVLAVAGGAYLTLAAGLDGEQTLSAGKHAAAAALLGVATVLAVGRLVDAVLPLPKVPGSRRRGGAGLLLGLAAAAGVGAWYGSQVSPFRANPTVITSASSSLTTGKALWVALVAAAVAAVVDLGIDAGLGALPADPPPVALPGPRPRAPWPARLGVAALLPVLIAAPPAYVIARVVLT